MAKSGIDGLAHIGLFVRDLDATEAFYCGVLGFTVAHRNAVEGDEGTIKVSFIQNGNLIIECIQLPVYDEKRTDGKVDHIALCVTNIEEVAQSLREKGVAFENEVYTAAHFWRQGSKWITFRGPDNEHLELTEVL